MKGKRYRYRPLHDASKTIRLIRVLPGSGSVTRISLEDVLLDDVTGQYDAISYKWGDPLPCRHVVVDGQKLQVRDNIYQCLKHLRQHQMISRPLWIDCISINQADIAEKEQQIAKMSRIFSSAKIVYIWLGRTSCMFHPERNAGHAELRDGLQEPGRLQMERLENMFQRLDPAALAAVDQLMRLVYDEYWHRLWVVQEVELAGDAHVIMGNMLINAGDFAAIYLTVRDASKPAYYAWLRRQTDLAFEDRGTAILDTHPLPRIPSNPYRLGDRRNTFAKLINSNRMKLCTDPRDRVYGLLGLVNPSFHPPVDYRCSVEALLVKTINCLIIEAKEADCKGPDYIINGTSMFDTWKIACVMQCLETKAEKVLSAIAASSVLAQEYLQQYDMMIEAREVLVPATRWPQDRVILQQQYISIQAPSGQIEHYRKWWTWFGRHNERHFRTNESGVPSLICAIGLSPAIMLSIDTHQRVRVERLICFDVSRPQNQPPQYKSRYARLQLSQSLSDSLNLFKTDWHDVFDGKFFDMRVPLSALQLIELADIWDLQAIRYNSEDRNIDWKMIWEVQGPKSAVDEIVQIMHDMSETML